MMLHFCLLKHADKQDVAMIVVGQNDIRCTEFGSEFNGLDISTNNNLQHPFVFPERQDAKKYSFPNISDPGELYTIHRLLLRRDAQDAAPKTVADGAELDEVKKGIIREMERNVVDGYHRFDTASDAYRPTVKGAILMTWKMIWPLENILRARHTRKMERVLREVMKDRESLSAEPAVALQTNQNAEHDESQQESYKIVFEGAIREDRNPAQVKRLLAKLARTDDAAVERLFTPSTKKILKHNLTKQEALNYKRKFETTGACCKIFRERSVSSPSSAASPSTAQQPHPNEPTGASSQHNESSACPRLTKKERASGLFPDIAERFRRGPIKNAVRLPPLGVCFIFLPIFIIFTLGAVLVGLKTGMIFFQTKKLEYFGAQTQGTVMNREVSQGNSSVEGKDDVQYYYVAYQFQASIPGRKEQVFSREEQVTKELYDQLKPDTKVPVVYNQKATVARIKGNYLILSFPDGEALPLFSSRGMGAMFVLLAITLFGGFAVIGLLLWLVSDLIALVFLSSTGRMVTAKVIELEKYKGSDSTEYSNEYAMICQFQPEEQGAVPIIGRQKISRDIYTAYRQKNTVDVRYVPKKPKWFKIVVNPDTKSATNRGGKSSYLPISIKLWAFTQYSGVAVPACIIGSILVGVQLYNMYQREPVNFSAAAFGAFVVILSSAAFLRKNLLQRRIQELEEHGRTACAEVIDIEEDGDLYVMVYQFDGGSRSITARETRDEPWGKEVGDSVPVRYLENNPTVFDQIFEE
ncbi:MAG: DUF3592 domain-containing protein [Candidatus Electrothrix sp. YB6]